jgi:hypothetical protein
MWPFPTIRVGFSAWVTHVVLAENQKCECNTCVLVAGRMEEHF